MGRRKNETKDITRQRIAEARDRKGLSNMELARQLRIDASAVRKWINQDLPVPEYHLKAIANICEVPLEWLKGESVPDVVQKSISILQGFDPEEAENHYPKLSKQAESESLALIYALEMCGHNLSEIKDKSKFSDYMIKSITNMVETYISTLN